MNRTDTPDTRRIRWLERNWWRIRYIRLRCWDVQLLSGLQLIELRSLRAAVDVGMRWDRKAEKKRKERG